MKIWQRLKSLLMFLMIGSTIIFASPVVQKAVDTFRDTPDEQINTTLGIDVDKYEIIFWTTILAALGTAVYVLIYIFASIISKSPDLYLKDWIDNSPFFALA